MDLYTRYGLYPFAAHAPLTAVLLAPATGVGPAALTVLLSALTAAAVAGVLVLRAGTAVAGAAGRAPLVLVAGVLVALVVLAAAVPGGAAGWEPVTVLAHLLCAFPLAALAALRPGGRGVRGLRARVPLLAGLLVASGGGVAVAAAHGAQGAALVRVAVGGAGWFGFLALAVVLSLWLLDVVRDLDAAQRDRARLAVAEERLRFARDLHDVVGRDLSAIAVQGELVAQLARRGRPEVAEHAERLQQQAHATLAEVRAVVRGSRRTDLAAELAGARSLLASAGVRCEVVPGPDLPPGVQEALAWAVREGVTNVVRHSEARTCRIGVQVHRDPGGGRAAVLRVEDDGVPRAGGAAGRAAGSGLAGLRERLAQAGGSLHAGRRPDGFALTATVPLPGTGPGPERAPAEGGAGAARQDAHP
ncbi:hypothetical protein NUM3379_30160 [Kineococcus sp. NUM-3379]